MVGVFVVAVLGLEVLDEESTVVDSDQYSERTVTVATIVFDVNLLASQQVLAGSYCSVLTVMIDVRSLGPPGACSPRRLVAPWETAFSQSHEMVNGARARHWCNIQTRACRSASGSGRDQRKSSGMLPPVLLILRARSMGVVTCLNLLEAYLRA